MLDIIEMMARALIWNGADLDDESDCIRSLCDMGYFPRKAVEKYIEKAMRVAFRMENHD